MGLVWFCEGATVSFVFIHTLDSRFTSSDTLAAPKKCTFAQLVAGHKAQTSSIDKVPEEHLSCLTKRSGP
jgi:hypothetical protein